MRDQIWAIIPNRVSNQAQAWLLKKCLESLFDVEPSMSGRVIVCDDESPRRDLVDGVIAKFPVKLMTHKVRKNYSEMINSGMVAANRAGGSGIITINNDIEHQTRFLGCLEEICDTDPEISVIGSLLFYPDGRIQHGGIDTDSIDHYCSDRFRGKHFEAPRPRYVHHVTGAWQFIRFHLMPYCYDVRFPITYQDVDFTLRLWEIGRRTYFTNKIFHIHHESATRGTSVTKAEIDSSWIFKETSYDFSLIDANIKAANK